MTSTVRRIVLAALLMSGAAASAEAMTIKVVGDQMILSGPVTGDDRGEILDVLNANRGITTVVLRNSSGGDAKSGYRAGELIRDRGLRTVVSGFCWSACTRMFLGGKTRYFSSDYPPEYTHLSFHGNYSNGFISLENVNRLGLQDWIIKHSDGKADPDLVSRWIHIPLPAGAAHFFHPSIAAWRGQSTFLCKGSEKTQNRMFGCEAIKQTALEMGIVTSLDLAASNDQAELRKTIPALPPVRVGVAAADMAQFPLKSESSLHEYERFLNAAAPKVFAKQVGGSQYAWTSSKTIDASLAAALGRCEERTKGKPCAVYALDDNLLAAP
jgi:hypothetical protein